MQKFHIFRLAVKSMKHLFLSFILLLPNLISAQTPSTNDSTDGISTDTSQLVFCGGVENSLPVGVSNWFFSDASANDYVYAYYSQSSSLVMKQVLMVIYRGNGEKAAGEQWFNVKPKWKYTFLKCHFPSKGDYKVLLYDENKKVLAQGSVTIMER